MNLPTAAIGTYRLLRRVVGGASGMVFQAIDVDSRQLVALKLLRSAGGDIQAQRRFDTEARILRRLDHPDVVQVLDNGHWQGQPWLAMKWAPGHDLTRYTSPPRLLPETLVADIGRRLALALAHAHENGVVHRDIKPGNVRIHLPQGMLKLADFGLARHDDGTATPTGVVLGSPAYMAPEVMCGERADSRADLYSLGVLLFELLTGRRPHAACTMGDWLREIASEPAPPLSKLRPDLPEPLVGCVMRLLQADPRARPGSARELAFELAAPAHGIALPA